MAHSTRLSKMNKAFRFAEYVEKRTQACAECGGKALYRFYSLSGEQFGSCKQHVEQVRRMTQLFHGDWIPDPWFKK